MKCALFIANVHTDTSTMLACIISDTPVRHTHFRRRASDVSVYLTIGGAKSDDSMYNAKSSTKSALKITTTVFTVTEGITSSHNYSS